MTQLEFMDCPTCGKRMVTTAPTCRHCGQSPQDAARLNRRSARQSTPPPYDIDEHADSDAHMAEATGGYTPEDDEFDYEEFLERESLKKSALPKLRVKLWVWITAWLLIVAMLLPFLVMWLN